MISTDKHKTKTTSIRLSHDLIGDIRQVAISKDWSVNKTMINLIKKGIEVEKKSMRKVAANE